MRDPSLQDLTPAQLLHVERACSRFEEECKKGRPPVIEDFLGESTEPERSLLRHELELLDKAYRERMSADTQDATPRQGEHSTVDFISPPSEGEDSSSVDPSWPRLPSYEILGELGHGGMGVVYKARHLALKRLVALKMIRLRASSSRDSLARFQAEAQTVARLRHPNIVQIFEIGEQDGQPFFSLEFVEGGSLNQKLKGEPQPPRDAAQMVETLSRAMQVAHDQGIVHRDLKPANVLLSVVSGQSSVAGENQLTTDNWQLTTSPKIADFGLAKQLDDESGHTQTGEIMGTPSYMAPEQASGKSRDIGPSADVYALGAILYEMLTGRPPFRGPSVLDTLVQVRTQEVIPPSRLQPNLPADLETICLKALQKEPRQRYDSALALAEDLHRYLHHEPILARPAGRIERTIKWTRRHPLRAALAALSVLLVGAVFAGLVFYARYQEKEAELAKQTIEQQIKEQQRLLKDQKEIEDSVISRQQVAAEAREDMDVNPDAAKQKLEKALFSLKDDPRLAATKTQLENLLRQAVGKIQDADKAKRFFKLRDDALFHSTAVAGLDIESNRSRTRDAGLRALAIWDIRPGEDSPPRFFQKHFAQKQRDELTIRCYELLLVLADAVGQPLAGETPEQQADEAMKLLGRAESLRGPTRALHLSRAKYFEQKGDADGAAIARKQADNPAASAASAASAVDHFLAAMAHLQRKEFAAADKEFSKVQQLDDGHFWGQFFWGLCDLAQQHWDKAQVRFSTCIARDRESKFVWSYILRALAYGELGVLAERQPKRGDADSLFALAEADFKKVEELLAEQMPRDALTEYTLYANRGFLKLRQKRPQAAIEDLEHADKLRPNRFEIHANLAAAYELSGDLKQSRAELDIATSLNPKAAGVHRSRARLSLLPEPKDYEGALKAYEQAIAAEPLPHTSADIANDHKERGLILLQLRRVNEALKAFDDAIRIDKDHAVAHRLRGETLVVLGRHAEALPSLNTYLRQAEKSLGVYQSKKEPISHVYRSRGAVYARMANPALAAMDFSNAIELDEAELDSTKNIAKANELKRKLAITHAQRGWAYVVLDNHQLGRKDFESALGYEPNNGDAYNGRAFCALNGGEPYARAVQDADKALELGPKTSRHVYNAARVYALAALRESIDPKQKVAKGVTTPIQRRALDLVREAVSLTPTESRSRFWREFVLSDRVMTFLRRTPEFARLHAEFNAAPTSEAIGPGEK